MSEDRNSRMDGVAWFLLFCGLVVALCIFSHEPAAGGFSAPNLLGVPGHLLARELFGILGSAVYVLLVAWFVLVLLLLRRESWLRWTRRLLGWLILVPCMALVADWLGHDWLPGPIYGSGGILGACLSMLWEDYMPGLLGFLVFSTATFLAIFLAADFLLGSLIDAVCYVCLGMSFVFAILVRGLNRLFLMGRRTDSAQVIETAELAEETDPAALDVPIQYSGFDAKEEVEPAATSITQTPAILPIKRLGLSNLPENNFEDYELPQIG